MHSPCTSLWTFGRGLPEHPGRPGEGDMQHARWGSRLSPELAFARTLTSKKVPQDYEQGQENGPFWVQQCKWAPEYEAKMSCSYTETLETLGSVIYYLPLHVFSTWATAPTPHQHPTCMPVFKASLQNSGPSGQLLGKKLLHNLSHTKN